MASNASSMSRSVPGSRSAVVRAAVVCSTKTEQVPVCFLAATNCSTCSVMSRTSRFLRVFTEKRCIGLRLPAGGRGMRGLELGDPGFVLQCQADIVEALKQTVARKFVDRERCFKTL